MLTIAAISSIPTLADATFAKPGGESEPSFAPVLAALLTAADSSAAPARAISTAMAASSVGAMPPALPEPAAPPADRQTGEALPPTGTPPPLAAAPLALSIDDAAPSTAVPPPALSRRDLPPEAERFARPADGLLATATSRYPAHASVSETPDNEGPIADERGDTTDRPCTAPVDPVASPIPILRPIDPSTPAQTLVPSATPPLAATPAGAQGSGPIAPLVGGDRPAVQTGSGTTPVHGGDGHAAVGQAGVAAPVGVARGTDIDPMRIVPMSMPSTPTAIATTAPIAQRPVAPPPAPDAPPPAPTVLPAFQAFGAALHRAAADERRPAPPEPIEMLSAAPALPVTPAVTPVTDPAPLDMAQPRWPEAMIARIEQLRDLANEADTSIRLHPDALGSIDVAFRRENEGVRVHFTAAEPATARLLAEAQPRLTELAEAKGLKLGGAPVDAGAGGGGDPRQPPTPRPAPPTRPAPARAASGPEPDHDDRLA